MDVTKYLNLRPEWEQWLEDAHFYGNSVLRWVTAFLIFLVVLMILYLIKGIVARRVARFAERTTTGWDDAILTAIQRTKFWFLLILSISAASFSLELSEAAVDVVQTVTVLALLLQAALWGNMLINRGTENYVQRKIETDPATVTSVAAISFLGKLVLFSLLVLLALDNLGIDVTALVAGLGVGGVAVALAVQNILGDLFASLSIVFDKPFVLGDFIIVGDQMGSVEKIGLKTTRLKSLSGEQLIFANNDLLTSRIRNFKRMFERRIVFSIGVTYQTPRTQLAEIPGILKEIVESQEKVRFDRAHFKEFGDSALNFEIVYYVLEPDYALYMDIQQAINLTIFDRFEQMGVEFAYPTRTVFIENAGPEENGVSERPV